MHKMQVSGQAVTVLLIVVLLAAFTTAKPEKKPEENVEDIPNDFLAEAIPDPEMPISYNSTLDATVLATNCGGTINLPAVGGAINVDYKYTLPYDNNERCVWLVNNKIGSYRAQLKVAFTLTANGFEQNVDTLKVLHWNRTTGMTSKTLAANTTTEVSAEAMFLSFSSDTSVTGTGFLVRIDLVSAVTSTNYTATNAVYYSTVTARNVSHGPYENYDVASIVVLRRSNVTASFLFSVDNLFSEVETSGTCLYDPLDVFEVIRTGVQRRSRLCGSFTTSPASFRTTDPVIALFGSDESITGQGYQLSW